MREGETVSKGKAFIVFVCMTIVVFGLIYYGISLTSDWGKPESQIDAEDAAKKLERLYGDIDVTMAEPVKGQIDLDPAEVGDALPDISKFPISVENTTDDYVEIFSSTEKSGTGNDGWLNEVADAFNQADILVNGREVSVKIRSIASGTATDYIRSGKYMPDAFSPSNEQIGRASCRERVL